MKDTRKLSVLAAAGAFPFLLMTALAQSGTPVAEPPPSSPPAETEPARPPGTVPGSINASNSTSMSTGSGSIKDLRFPAVDADSDGLISLSEFTVFMDAGNVSRRSGPGGDHAGISPTELLFRHIDRNSDNFLSETEVTAYQEEQDRNSARR